MDSIPCEPVLLEKAKASPLGPTTTANAASPLDKRLAARGQRASSHNDLAANTFKWLAKLPRETRPNALAVKFPRVANRLAEVWNRPPECERYLDDLMTDTRGDRQGFPPDVASDLEALKKHFLKSAKSVQYGIWGNRSEFG